MTKEQAEHVLDAYVTIKNAQWDKDAEESLRNVILDAMTSTTTPSITWRDTRPFTVPNVINDKPIVTLTTGGTE